MAGHSSRPSTVPLESTVTLSSGESVGRRCVCAMHNSGNRALSLDEFQVPRCVSMFYVEDLNKGRYTSG
jgi:hypothetical protein